MVGGQPPLRSVDSESRRRVIEPRNFVAVSLRLGQVRGPRQAAYNWSRRVCLVTPGSESRANGQEGSPGTLGDPDASIEMPEGDPAYQLQVDPRPPRPGSTGTKTRTHRWYRQAKETKCGETGGRESECLIRLLIQGNRPDGTLGRKGDTVS